MTSTKRKIFKTTIFQNCKEKLIFWANSTDNNFCILNTNEILDGYGEYDFILAIGVKTELFFQSEKQNFEQLDAFQKQTKDWLFGHLSYDLKNDIENLNSQNDDKIKFPSLYFFQPQKIFFVKENMIECHFLNSIQNKDIQKDFEQIQRFEFQKKEIGSQIIQSKISKEEYLKSCELILQHIHRGDIYEINFCQEFFVENCDISPVELYLKLNETSKTPQSCFYRIKNHYLISLSPERFLKKIKNTVVAQPIKGTTKRGVTKREDEKLLHYLKTSEKEIAENVMIVDLMRNDLSKIAKKNSVKVEELCQVYSFEQVHQMISTVSAESKDNFTSVEIIKKCFPMGSMTGTPKIKAMQLAEKYEKTKRGLYSGSVGYFTPVGDFDFNVVIRSVLYSKQSKYLSFMVGGAITSLSVPLEEYNECLIKIKAIKEILS